MSDDEGIDVSSVRFGVSDDDRLLVEITYSERRHQLQQIAKTEIISFDADQAHEEVAEIMDSLQDLVDIVSTKLRNPPAKIPGRF